jgi:hypothetical protein
MNGVLCSNQRFTCFIDQCTPKDDGETMASGWAITVPDRRCATLRLRFESDGEAEAVWQKQGAEVSGDGDKTADLSLRRVHRPDVAAAYQCSPDGYYAGWEVTLRNAKGRCAILEALDFAKGIDGGCVARWTPVVTFYPKKCDSEGPFECSRRWLPTLMAVDNFYDDPDAVREFALNRREEFVAHPNNHKGFRTESVHRPDCVRKRIEQLLGRRIDGWERYGTNGCFQWCPAGTTLVYHCDQQQYAGVVFLTPDAPPGSGTTLWRAKANRVMNFEPHGLLAARAGGSGKSSEELSAEAFSGGHFDATRFERVDEVGNVFNRLVLWDARTIHSATDYFGQTIDDGRLFQLFFFDLLPE